MVKVLDHSAVKVKKRKRKKEQVKKEAGGRKKSPFKLE